MSSPSRTHAIQAPKGTRDYYPADLLRRRFIEKAWRDVSVRHGFEEIDGPTFEHTDLYTVKSGEGIVSEIFGVFSGKDEEQVKAAGSGQAPYALRPEFTPTLARMYAAKAAQLPKPAKWFMAGPFFRAERPQRGRLREFLQWNVDFLGGEETPEAKAAADAEILGCVVGLLDGLGLASQHIRIRISDRNVAAGMLLAAGLSDDRREVGFALLDRRAKMPADKFTSEAAAIGLDIAKFDSLVRSIQTEFGAGARSITVQKSVVPPDTGVSVTAILERDVDLRALRALWEALKSSGTAEWCDIDLGIVRGLAYYTGMVFEVVAGGERAVAGGGRYDNLIELFGGPPTPAVGFGMGDVVLSLVLQDRGLMPEGNVLLDRLSEPGVSYRPDVFVIPNDQPESIAQLKPLVATLRRAKLHARHSYKATKNIGKLFKEASDAGARFAAVIESATEATLKDLDKGTQDRIPLSELAAAISSRR